MGTESAVCRLKQCIIQVPKFFSSFRSTSTEWETHIGKCFRFGLPKVWIHNNIILTITKWMGSEWDNASFTERSTSQDFFFPFCQYDRGEVGSFCIYRIFKRHITVEFICFNSTYLYLYTPSIILHKYKYFTNGFCKRFNNYLKT